MAVKIYAVAASVRIGESHYIAPVFIIGQTSEEAAEGVAVERIHASMHEAYGEVDDRYEILAYSAEELTPALLKDCLSELEVPA